MDGGIYGLHTPPGESAYASERLAVAENLMSTDEYQPVRDPQQHYYNHHHQYNRHDNRFPAHGSDELISVASAFSEVASIGNHEIRLSDEDRSSVKAKIASHPQYPRLLQAYIECQKIGAPQEIACLLSEVQQQNDNKVDDGVASSGLGVDPELDEFMETYSNLLMKYKSDLSRPFDEATDFLNKMETQLGNLCKGAFAVSISDDGIMSSDEEASCGEVDIAELQPRDEAREIKDKLLHRFGSHIGSLKKEFSKTKKKGKLPREARLALLEWWNTHSKWPYPTETDKIVLAERTGLDPRQINNWFINQRKRHWKPSENMQFALMGNLSSGHILTDD